VTFELLIGLATSLVFCRLAPGSVHADATAGLGAALGAVLAWPAEARDAVQLAALELPLLPHELSAKEATVTIAAQPAPPRLTKQFICRGHPGVIRDKSLPSVRPSRCMRWTVATHAPA
jgi:hypothetical protein